MNPVISARVIPLDGGQVSLMTTPDPENPAFQPTDARTSSFPMVIAVGPGSDVEEEDYPQSIEVEVWVDEVPLADGWNERGSRGRS